MDLLDRLHGKLLAATADTAPADGSRPHLTIADLYQRLIPYRAVRGELGVMELAEYEHVLLRLLAGERNFVELEQPAVTVEFERELASPHPIVGIYRDYASVGVRVMGASAIDERHRAHPSHGRRAENDSVLAPAGSPRDVGTDAARSRVGESLAPPSVDSMHAPTAVASQRKCQACQRVLPDQPEILYCPFCGVAQGPSPCPHCGTTLQEGWDYCVRCGTGRRSQSHHV